MRTYSERRKSNTIPTSELAEHRVALRIALSIEDEKNRREAALLVLMNAIYWATERGLDDERSSD